MAQESYDVGDEKVTCQEGTETFYDNNNLKSCMLEGEQKIQDLTCYQKIYFYKNGKIQSCKLAFMHILQNTPVKRGPDDDVVLYSNGKLKEFTLAKTYWFWDVKYLKNTRMSMDLSGKVTVLEEPEPTKWQQIQDKVKDKF